MVLTSSGEQAALTNDHLRPPMSRAAVTMHGLAVLVLLAMGFWGAALYSSLPEFVPTHWNSGGEADAFGQKSIWTTFGPLLIASVWVLTIAAVHYALNRSRLLVPAERRVYDLSFGYVNLSLAALFAWVSLSGWYGLELGPLFIAFVLLAGMPVLIIIGFHLPAMTRERKAMMDPNEPSMDPAHWVLGGFFYNNPKDPRAFVPKPPHTGTGVTMNLSSTGGRLALIGILLLIVVGLVLPFLL